MSGDDVITISDEATVYWYLNGIRDGRKVSVSYMQRPHGTVCWMIGRWVGQDPPTRVGWMVVADNGEALILPTDKIRVFRSGRSSIHVTVILGGRRLPRSAATVRRARIAGLFADETEGGAK